MQNASKLSREILVPFCPESVLSGIHYPDFMNAVWYRRCFVLDDLSNGNRVLLHFEAVDHFSTVYLNGTELGSHTGGFTPFSFDITGQVRPGENVLRPWKAGASRAGGTLYPGIHEIDELYHGALPLAVRLL